MAVGPGAQTRRRKGDGGGEGGGGDGGWVAERIVEGKVEASLSREKQLKNVDHACCSHFAAPLRDVSFVRSNLRSRSHTHHTYGSQGRKEAQGARSATVSVDAAEPTAKGIRCVPWRCRPAQSQRVRRRAW